MKARSLLWLGPMAMLLSACGESQISKKLTTSSLSSSSSPSSKISAVSGNEVSNAQVNLWMSPARDGAPSTSAYSLTQSASALNAITRYATPLTKLLEGSGLRNSVLDVQNDSSGTTGSTNYANYFSNKNVSWTHRDFQNFMGFAHFAYSIQNANNLFGAYAITRQRNSNDQAIFPLRVYVNECCNATMTGYDPDSRDVMFFRHSDSSSDPYYRFNMIDEADVAHHEFGHVLQHTLNRTALELPVGQNPALDAILEGLSDFYAASVVQTENIFPYMENNISGILSNVGSTRYAPSGGYRRNLGPANNLTFPNNYVWESHLDGRVLAAALNDIRKTLASYGLGHRLAFEEVTKVAYAAFAQASSSISFHGFAKLLMDQWYNQSHSTVCPLLPGLSNCREGVKNAMSEILLSRGLYRPITTSVPGGGSVMEIPSTLKYINHPLFNDGDGVLESCETIMVFPYVRNISSNIDLVHGWATLAPNTNQAVTTALQGFTATTMESLSATTQKILPWLKPGETTADLIGSGNGNTSGRLFQVAFESAFLRPFPLNTSTYKNAAVGWILRAPASGTASLRFYIQTSPYNSVNAVRYYAPSAVQSITVTQTRSACD